MDRWDVGKGLKRGEGEMKKGSEGEGRGDGRCRRGNGGE